jgi:cold shock CspA family protein/ribosome-associated translation inhibitor RaiA
LDIPLHISFRDMEPSQSIKGRIEERVDRLEKFFDRITSCRVVVSAPHRQHHKGKLYHVAISLVRDAFNALQRQLRDHARRKRGETKTHEVPPHGRIARVFDDYGFIETPDGRGIYFHRNSVTNDSFDSLAADAEVRFVAMEGESEKGPQASTVSPLGKRHIVE